MFCNGAFSLFYELSLALQLLTQALCFQTEALLLYDVIVAQPQTAILTDSLGIIAWEPDTGSSTLSIRTTKKAAVFVRKLRFFRIFYLKTKRCSYLTTILFLGES